MSEDDTDNGRRYQLLVLNGQNVREGLKKPEVHVSSNRVKGILEDADEVTLENGFKVYYRYTFTYHPEKQQRGQLRDWIDFVVEDRAKPIRIDLTWEPRHPKYFLSPDTLVVAKGFAGLRRMEVFFDSSGPPVEVIDKPPFVDVHVMSESNWKKGSIEVLFNSMKSIASGRYFITLQREDETIVVPVLVGNP